GRLGRGLGCLCVLVIVPTTGGEQQRSRSGKAEGSVSPSRQLQHSLPHTPPAPANLWRVRGAFTRDASFIPPRTRHKFLGGGWLGSHGAGRYQREAGQ